MSYCNADGVNFSSFVFFPLLILVAGFNLRKMENKVEIFNRSAFVFREAAQAFNAFGTATYKVSRRLKTNRRKPTNYTKPRKRKKT